MKCKYLKNIYIRIYINKYYEKLYTYWTDAEKYKKTTTEKRFRLLQSIFPENVYTSFQVNNKVILFLLQELNLQKVETYNSKAISALRK